jgi:hypothetical protein
MDSIKREYPRCSTRIRAMITIGLEGKEGAAVIRSGSRGKEIRLMTETKDISWGGFCLRFASLPEDPEDLFSRARVHKLVGKTVKVMLSEPKVTLWGDVIRFDAGTREMAVIITKVSDYDLWQHTCSSG